MQKGFGIEKERLCDLLRSPYSEQQYIWLGPNS